MHIDETKGVLITVNISVLKHAPLLLFSVQFSSVQSLSCVRLFVTP